MQAEPGTEEAEILDLRGLRCPLPALFARRALLRATPGALVEVHADDPMARVDILHMCHHEGFEVVRLKDAEGTVEAILRRPSGNA